MNLLFCSDIHLSDTQPPCRKEDDWIASQQNMLDELLSVAEHNDAILVVCGDFFDRPKVSPRLLNMVMGELAFAKVPVVILPGQHDIYGHNIATIRETSLYSLDFLDNVTIIENPVCWEMDKADFDLHFFPFGTESPLLQKVNPNRHTIACLHTYAWDQKPVFIESETGFSRNIMKAYREAGYSNLFIGDNHLPFEDEIKGCVLVNCGALQRTKSDQEKHIPKVYLMDSGTYKAETIPFRFRDYFEPVESKVAETAFDMKDQLSSLFNNKECQKISFGSMMELCFEDQKIPVEVAEYVRRMIN